PVGEVAPSPADALIHACYHLAPLPPLLPGGAFVAVLTDQAPDIPRLQIRKLRPDVSSEGSEERLVSIHRHLMRALGFGQRLFFLTEQTGIGNSVTCRQRGKGFQPYINTHLYSHLLISRWQWHGLSALTGEAHVALVRAAELDGRRLGRALQWAMHDHLHLPDVHDAQALGLRIQLTPNGHLRKREASIAALPTKTWGARLLIAVSYPTAECLESQVNAHRDVL